MGQKMNIAEQGQLRAKPGYWERLMFRWGNKLEFGDAAYKPYAGRIAYEVAEKAFGLGLGKAEANRVALDAYALASKLGQTAPGRGHDFYLENSNAFRETAEGVDYLTRLKGTYNVKEMASRELAGEMVGRLKDLGIEQRSALEMRNFSNELKYGDHGFNRHDIVNHKDYSISVDAGMLAYSLGIDKESSLRVAEEVYQAADGIQLSDPNYKLDNLLNQSPTFSSFEQGVQYLQTTQVVSGVEKLHTDQSEAEILENKRVQTASANDMRRQYGLADMNVAGNGMSVLPQNGVTPGNMVGNAMKNPLGMILMAVIGFLLTKSMGGSGLAGVATGGVTAFLTPFLGEFINGFSGQSSMSEQGLSHLERYAAQKQNEELRTAEMRERQQLHQQGQTDRRDIGDHRESADRKDLTVSQQMALVRDRGFDGLREYYGANENGFEEFLKKNNLLELARRESDLRLQGGDWLKATQEGLTALGRNGETMEQTGGKRIGLG